MKRLACSLLLFGLVLAGCGKKGPLISPELLAPAAPTIAVSQFDRLIRIRVPLPQRDLSGRSLQDLAGIELYRKTSPLGATSECIACEADYMLVRTLHTALQEQPAELYGGVALFEDRDVRAGREYSYYAVSFNQSSVKGPRSVVAKTAVFEAALPPVLTATAEPTEIRLKIQPDVGQHGRVSGYNLYRTFKGEKFSPFPFKNIPVSKESFADSGLVRDRDYQYAVTAIVKGVSGHLQESAFSKVITIRLSDGQ